MQYHKVKTPYRFILSKVQLYNTREIILKMLYYSVLRMCCCPVCRFTIFMLYDVSF
jgi:hypothetical protein